MDRWLHVKEYHVPYGYIILGPFWEVARAISTLFFLWGAHMIVWKELEHRLPEEHNYWWWLVAKVLLIFTFLLCMFYWILYIAFAAVWVRFASLDTIDDVGGRWAQFWVAMTGFFFGFSLLISLAAAATFYKARFQRDGHIRKVRPPGSTDYTYL